MHRAIYADGRYMHNPYLCRCPAYGYVQPIQVFLFFRSEPKKGRSGSAFSTRRSCSDTPVLVLIFQLVTMRTEIPGTSSQGRENSTLLISCRRSFRKSSVGKNRISIIVPSIIAMEIIMGRSIALLTMFVQ
ncbi:hypothetical protein CI662_027005 [Klebsiella pneumoniae subsp. pneumoniae]|nr:hypothetical protein BME19_22480 [Klebsiella pneumoniae]TNK08916.1 hypothetical protein CI662_027005 [Klebsiella pneumoniae subsp. pneumoniae]